jgi:hypothetical protein
MQTAREINRLAAHVYPHIGAWCGEKTASNPKATADVENIGSRVREVLPQDVVDKSEAPAVPHVPHVLLEVAFSEERVVEGRVSVEPRSRSLRQTQ